ncbi:DNA polymerase [Flavobacterium sp.]|jgi:DNA polymerase I-like protein with 3'-5' exonuclease and polymerase domains|uniref:DNA polymerase n=1 Tax=Flavobacterium sp. TaxID=239 RepID=UPI0037BEBD6D
MLTAETDCTWSWWEGQQLGRYFALDTETELITGHKIPQLAMVSVSDGMQTYIVHPDQLAVLLVQHLSAGCHMVCHNIAFDFWVMHKNLAGSPDAINWLWSAVDQQQVHDSMLLAGLIGIAQTDDDRLPSLADVAQQLLGVTLEKDLYRLRYGETIGTDWEQLDPGFFQYAATDAAITYQVFCRLTAIAKQITDAAGVQRRFGFLTEGIQIKAAICLDLMHRNGLHIDTERAAQLETDLEQNIQQAICQLEKHDSKLFHKYKKQPYLFKVNKDSGLPKMNQKQLLVNLAAIAVGHSIQVPGTQTGRVSTSVNDCWNEYRGLHSFIESYCTFKELTKLRTFFDALSEPVIHPRYRVLVRTGRTSCSGPNIQQLPRSSHIREAVVPRPGYLFLIIDYSAIELRTLAAVCYARYGFSKLGDVLKAGIDPHSYTAAMFAGIGLEQFQHLPNKKQLRQQAKAINFGLPGGLGAASLVSYAKHSYGVDMTLDQATQFRTMLTELVYPELKLYLSEDSATVLAATLQTDAVLVRSVWSEPRQYGMLRKVVEGKPQKADGTPYSESTVSRVWQQLAMLNQNPALVVPIAGRDASDTSPLRKLMCSPVATPTGRIRGGVGFTAARNTPFQGLAADGAKLAMWELVKAGYRIAAFVHDEFVIELPIQADHTAAAQKVEHICCIAMQQLLGDIPVSCEYALADRWYKAAAAVTDDTGKLVQWQPGKPN